MRGPGRFSVRPSDPWGTHPTGHPRSGTLRPVNGADLDAAGRCGGPDDPSVDTGAAPGGPADSGAGSVDGPGDGDGAGRAGRSRRRPRRHRRGVGVLVVVGLVLIGLRLAGLDTATLAPLLGFSAPTEPSAAAPTIPRSQPTQAEPAVVPVARFPALADVPVPTDERVVALADRMQLTDLGRALFFDESPHLATGAEVATACERTGPSGCFSAAGIAIFAPSDERLADAMVTIAAHELTHAFYARLTEAERAEIDALVADAAARLPADHEVHESVTWSAEGEAGKVGNERFAYFGTEIAPDQVVSDALEAYWGRVFADRGALVEIRDGHRAMLDGVVTEVQQAWDSVAQLEQDAARSRAEYEADRAALDRDTQQLNSLDAEFGAMDPERQATATITSTAPDGSQQEWGAVEWLSARRAELTQRRDELTLQQGRVVEAEEAAGSERSRVAALDADVRALLAAAHPEGIVG